MNMRIAMTSFALASAISAVGGLSAIAQTQNQSGNGLGNIVHNLDNALNQNGGNTGTYR